MSTNEVDKHVALSPLLDDVAWQPWPALGGHWMIKWTTREDGYILVITDGIRGWIENRSSEYVEEKAQEWAACVAAAAGEVAELVLRALLSAAEGAGDSQRGDHSARGCRVEVTWHSHDDILTLKLRDQLDQDMPYCWTFCLTALQHTQMQHLIIVPLAVQLQLLQVQLQHKDTQLQQLRQQLSDFTPEGTAPARLQQLQQEEITRAAAAKILKSGAAATLAQHLRPDLLRALRTGAACDLSSASLTGLGTGSINKTPRQRKRPPLTSKTRAVVAATPAPLSEREELQRRQQRLGQARDANNKINKKKKLHI